jgi:hypothetical protein
MLEPHVEYFRQIGMPQPIIDRAQSVCNFFRRSIPGPVSHVFIGDAYEDPSGIRRYTSLWLHSANVIMECKNFVIDRNIDFVDIRSRVVYISFSTIELDELQGVSTSRSKFNVGVRFSASSAPLGCGLNAVHNNCPYLFEFVSAVFMPHLQQR